MRIQEREPGVSADFAEVAQEFGLFSQGGDKRRECEAISNAVRTERGRKAIGAFGHALIRIENELRAELRGPPPGR